MLTMQLLRLIIYKLQQESKFTFSREYANNEISEVYSTLLACKLKVALNEQERTIYTYTTE